MEESGGVMGGGGPPGSPRSQDELNMSQDHCTAQEDSWVLATIDAWISSGRPKEDIVMKVMKAFSLQDLRTAASLLRNGKWCEPGIKVPQEGAPDYSRQLAEVVHDGLVSVQNRVPLKVHFWVSAHDILKVPGIGPFPDHLEEPEVSARLGVVDTQLQLVLDKLGATEHLERTVAGLAETVTLLQQQLREQQQQGLSQQSLGQQQQDPVQRQSWAELAGGRGRQGRLRSLQVEDQGRERSTSSKRGREGRNGNEEQGRRVQRPRLEENEVRGGLELCADHPAPPGSALSQDMLMARGTGERKQRIDGFIEVQRRKRGGAINKGSSTVQAEGGEKPPYSVFLSGTNTATTEATVREKLALCAEAIVMEGEDMARVQLEILSVVPINLKIPQGETPRSRCWKVTVAAQCAPHMARSEAYPADWGWRRWNNGPRIISQDRQGERRQDVGA